MNNIDMIENLLINSIDLISDISKETKSVSIQKSLSKIIDNLRNIAKETEFSADLARGAERYRALRASLIPQDPTGALGASWCGDPKEFDAKVDGLVAWLMESQL